MEKNLKNGKAEGTEKDMAKDVEQSVLSSIKSLMETMGWTIDQAMTALKVPEAERQTYRNLLEKQ